MTQKHILVRAAKSPFSVSTIQDALYKNHLMTNAGNLLFQHAFIKHIYSEDCVIHTVDDNLIDKQRLAAINQHADAIYLPFANAFRPEFQQALANWCVMLDHIKIPVVVVGIGAQCFGSQALEELSSINALVKLFCQKILDKSASIGVRGNFTAEYLHALGIHHVDVIGCPSMFFFGDRLPAPRPLPSPQISRIAVHFTEKSPAQFNVSHPQKSELFQQLDQFLRTDKKYQITYFAQDTQEIEMLWKQTWQRSFFPAGDTAIPLETHGWINALKQYDLVIGTRIHGTIAGILAGTPSILICHDSRTRELADYFKIPYIDPSNHESVDMATISRKLELSSMHADHPSRFHRYVDFLRRNGVINNVRFSPDQPSDFSQFDARLASVQFPPINRIQLHKNAGPHP